MNEIQDLKNHEKVSIVFRYYDKRLNVLENCIGVYITDKMDDETLFFKSSFLGLKIENMRGQYYNGAASMRSSYSEVAKRIQDEKKLSL
jgi:hypothetical protein